MVSISLPFRFPLPLSLPFLPPPLQSGLHALSCGLLLGAAYYHAVLLLSITIRVAARARGKYARQLDFGRFPTFLGGAASVRWPHHGRLQAGLFLAAALTLPPPGTPLALVRLHVRGPREIDSARGWFFAMAGLAAVLNALFARRAAPEAVALLARLADEAEDGSAGKVDFLVESPSPATGLPPNDLTDGAAAAAATAEKAGKILIPGLEPQTLVPSSPPPAPVTTKSYSTSFHLSFAVVVMIMWYMWRMK